MSAPDPLLTGLGEAIRDLRDELGISQERLGLDSGVHRNYIGGIERAERRPTLATVATLAATLNVRPSELIARAEERAEHHGAAWPEADRGSTG
ncbi:MAG TPA: helix-turn-helix transcriptional regulator [Solirubrobacteraceae bacterium]|nr:helix-turn-helix transcriptional regulator [Solirubrobacteraceae bacterium]